MKGIFRSCCLRRHPRRALASAIGLSLLVYLLLGLHTSAESDGDHRFGLIPRHHSDVEVRGRTYHLAGPSVDLRQKAQYEERRHLVEIVRPHLVARRDILDQVSASGNPISGYLSSGGEEAIFSLTCDSCALVGTAGVLLQSRRGKSIDSTSCVFRLGFSPVKGFEEDVGEKTTARIVNSNGFYPFLKKPEKLMAGQFKSENWFLFDRQVGDLTRLYIRLRPLLRKEKDRIAFHWFNRNAEIKATESLKEAGNQLNYKMIGVKASALWYAIKVIEDAGCKSVRFYGVPDSKLCKRNMNIEVRSRYWDPKSSPLCENGTDSGMNDSKSSPAMEVMTLAERRGLLAWSNRRKNVTFETPSWP